MAAGGFCVWDCSTPSRPSCYQSPKYNPYRLPGVIYTSTAGLPMHLDCWSLLLNFISKKSGQKSTDWEYLGMSCKPRTLSRYIFHPQRKPRPGCTIIRVRTRPRLQRNRMRWKSQSAPLDLPPETMRIKSEAAQLRFSPFSTSGGCRAARKRLLQIFKLVSRKFQMFKFETT